MSEQYLSTLLSYLDAKKPFFESKPNGFPYLELLVGFESAVIKKGEAEGYQLKQEDLTKGYLGALTNHLKIKVIFLLKKSPSNYFKSR